MEMQWRKKFCEGSLFGDASANNIRGTCAAWILEGYQQQESDFDRRAISCDFAKAGRHCSCNHCRFHHVLDFANANWCLCYNGYHNE